MYSVTYESLTCPYSTKYTYNASYIMQQILYASDSVRYATSGFFRFLLAMSHSWNNTRTNTNFERAFIIVGNRPQCAQSSKSTYKTWHSNIRQCYYQQLYLRVRLKQTYLSYLITNIMSLPYSHQNSQD